jgi:chromosome segregation ATPase
MRFPLLQSQRIADELRHSLKDREHEVAALKKRVDELEQAQREHDLELRRARGDSDELRERLRVAEASLEMERSLGKDTSPRGAESDSSLLRQTVKELEDLVRDLRADKSDLSSALDKSRLVVEEERANRLRWKDEFAKLLEEAEALRAERDSLDGSLQSAKRQVEEQEGEVTNLRRALAEIRGRLQTALTSGGTAFGDYARLKEDNLTMSMELDKLRKAQALAVRHRLGDREAGAKFQRATEDADRIHSGRGRGLANAGARAVEAPVSARSSGGGSGPSIRAGSNSKMVERTASKERGLVRGKSKYEPRALAFNRARARELRGLPPEVRRAVDAEQNSRIYIDVGARVKPEA